MAFMSACGEFGRGCSVVGEVGIGVAAFHDGGEVAGVDFAIGLGGGGDVLGGFDDGNAGGGVFGETDLSAGLGVGADGLDAEAVGEERVMANLIDLAAGSLRPGAWRPSR